jgi:S1-C subfamily serine protease
MVELRVIAIGLLLSISMARADTGKDDLDTLMMRATVKLSHEQSTATGFILDRGAGKGHVLVTAAHVLEKTPGPETTVIFRRLTSTGDFAREPFKLPIRKEGKPLWVRHPTEDIAAIRINPAPGVDLGRVSTELLASDETLRTHKIHVGDNVAVLGYPHREEGTPAGFAILRAGAIASYPFLPTVKYRTFYVSANTFEGDSGAPVYLARPGGPAMIVGLVSAQRFLDEEAKMIYSTSKLRHRLGLAVVVHASFIRDTIERLN